MTIIIVVKFLLCIVVVVVFCVHIRWYRHVCKWLVYNKCFDIMALETSFDLMNLHPPSLILPVVKKHSTQIIGKQVCIYCGRLV